MKKSNLRAAKTIQVSRPMSEAYSELVDKGITTEPFPSFIKRAYWDKVEKLRNNVTKE